MVKLVHVLCVIVCISEKMYSIYINPHVFPIPGERPLCCLQSFVVTRSGETFGCLSSFKKTVRTSSGSQIRTKVTPAIVSFTVYCEPLKRTCRKTSYYYPLLFSQSSELIVTYLKLFNLFHNLLSIQISKVQGCVNLKKVN